MSLSSLLLAGGSAGAQTACRRVNGSGSYGLGPFEPLRSGDEPVFLVTDLGFDETMVFCKVATNHAPFRFPTAGMGVVELGAHQFFMDMQSLRIDSLAVLEGADGPEAVYDGVLRSETRLFSGDRMQRFVEENVSFGCRAVHISGAPASVRVTRTNFSMTARFDPAKEHAAIFGREATFAGLLERGNIMVVG